MEFVRTIRQILMHARRRSRELRTKVHNTKEPAAQQERAACNHEPPQSVSWLSPEQKQQLTERIAQKLASERGNVALQAKNNGSGFCPRSESRAAFGSRSSGPSDGLKSRCNQEP